MRLLREIAIFQTVKSKVIISLFETVRLSVLISLRYLYNSLNSIKEKLFFTNSALNLLIKGKIIKSQMHSKLYNLPLSHLFLNAEN